ncbi:SAM-dependent RNA methyltransferase [Pyronema omphalodes]|nr:SAM-dependent RNA methyltransferase [Pyronema omphalodes]
MPNYVVEHMEPEIGPWSTLEYIAIANETTADSTFYISSLHDSLAANMPESLKPILESNPRFVATSKDITTLAAGVPKERICLLDPRAEKTLSPEDSGMFDWFVFGGILGDDPPRDRTAELRVHGFTGRNLQKLQMTTDTAVRVTRLVIEEKKSIESGIPFIWNPELKVKKNETVQMPFRYVTDEKGEPILPAGMFELIKEDANKDLTDLFD